jgi:hypothetical protein
MILLMMMMMMMMMMMIRRSGKFWDFHGDEDSGPVLLDSNSVLERW